MSLPDDSWRACWAQDRCKGYPSACGDACESHLLLRSQYLQARIPAKYQRARLGGLAAAPGDPPSYAESLAIINRYASKAKELVSKGVGLFLWACPTPRNPLGTGTGKTTAACAVANELIMATCYEARLEPMVLFVNTAELLDSMRRAMDDESVAEEVATVNHLLRTVPLVVFDDLGVEMPTKWVRQQLYVCLNHRVQNGRAIIATSNRTIEYLAEEERLGHQIASRLEEACTPLEMTGVDRRKGGSW